MAKKKNCGHCKKPLVKGKCTNCGPDTKRTPEMVAAIEECLRLDMPISKTCQAVGINESTFYLWVKQDPAFVTRMRAAKFFATNVARRSVIKQMAFDGSLALKYLERKEKDEFSTKSIVKNETPTQELDPDERQELKKLFEDNNIIVPGFDEDGEFERELG